MSGIDDMSNPATLVERIYDVVVAPDRLEELLDIWLSHLKEAKELDNRFGLFTENGLMSHIERAGTVLAGAMETGKSSAETWVETFRNAALVVNRKGKIVACNRAATLAFAVDRAASITCFELVAEDETELSTRLADIRPRTDTNVLRLRRREHLRPVLMRMVADIGNDPELVGIATTIVAWPAITNSVLRQSFAVTEAEAAVLRSLVMGATVKEISTGTNRTELTVRSHVRALLEKTGTRNQIELVRLTLGLLDSLDQSAGESALADPTYVSPAGNIYRTLVLSDGRKLDYLLHGDAHHMPFVFMPNEIGLTRLHPLGERAMADQNLRMIVPVRAGYGRSSPLPRNRHVHEVATADLLALLDHLGIAQCPVVAQGDVFQMAVRAAHAAPKRFTHVFGCGATLPAVSARHYTRMSKWSRFVSANARYAPRAFPYVSAAFFALAKRLGKKRFLQTVMSSSPADLKVLEDPEIMASMIQGSEIVLSETSTAHQAWAIEGAANLSTAWSELLRTCPVPLTLFAGQQDPFSPYITVKEYAAALPNLCVRDYPQAGHLYHPYIEDLLVAVTSACHP